MFFLSYLSMYCVQSLVDCKVKLPQARTYADVGRAAYGPYGGLLVDVVVVTCQLGFVCAYLLIIGDTFHQLLPEWYAGYYILVAFPLLIPLVFLRSMTALAPVSVLTVIVFSIGCSVILWHGFTILENRSYDFIHLDTFGLYFGQVVFAFEGINLIIPIQDSMQTPANFNKLLYLSYFLATSCFAVFSALCYAFYYDATQDIITLNDLGEGLIPVIVKLAFAIVVFLSFPVGMFPITQIVERAVFPAISSRDQENPNNVGAAGYPSAVLGGNEGYHNPNEDPLLPVGSDIQTESEDDGVNASALKRVSVFLSFFLAVCVYIYSLFDYSVDSDPLETTFPLITHLIFLCLSLSLNILYACLEML